MSISDRLKKKKVAIYIRVSTRYQVDRDSLQVQRRKLTAYSEMVLGIPDYTVFEDAGYSAKNTDRPDYQLMMERLRTGEFSHLLVWKIDRSSHLPGRSRVRAFLLAGAGPGRYQMLVCCIYRNTCRRFSR